MSSESLVNFSYWLSSETLVDSKTLVKIWLWLRSETLNECRDFRWVKRHWFSSETLVEFRDFGWIQRLNYILLPKLCLFAGLFDRAAFFCPSQVFFPKLGLFCPNCFFSPMYFFGQAGHFWSCATQVYKPLYWMSVRRFTISFFCDLRLIDRF